MIIYEDYDVKTLRFIEERFNGKSTRDEAQSTSFLFTAIWEKIKSQGNYAFVAKEVSEIIKRVQEEAKYFRNTNNTRSPSFSMDDIRSLTIAYTKKCIAEKIDHRIVFTSEQISVYVSSKANDRYQMKTGKINSNKLILNGELLAVMLMKILDLRYKSRVDIEDIFKRTRNLGYDIITAVDIVLRSTFKIDLTGKAREDVAASNVGKGIVVNQLKGFVEIDLNKIGENEYSFSIDKDEDINFMISANTLISFIFLELMKTPNISSIIGNLEKESIKESLEDNLRIFRSYIYDNFVIMNKIREKESGISTISDEDVEEL